jgi:hypothetical protein
VQVAPPGQQFCPQPVCGGGQLSVEPCADEFGDWLEVAGAAAEDADPDVARHPPRSPGCGPEKRPAASKGQVAAGCAPAPAHVRVWSEPRSNWKSMDRPVACPVTASPDPPEGVKVARVKAPLLSSSNWRTPS